MSLAYLISTFKNPYKKLVIMRLFAENMFVLLLQYIGLMLSTLLPYATPLWLASGTACAFIFLRGPTILPGIGLGTLIAYYSVTANANLAITGASLFMLQAFLLLSISYRVIQQPTLIFYRRWQTFTFIGLAILLLAITSLILLCLHLFAFNPAGLLLNKLFFQLWLSHFLANLNGVLIVAYALVALDVYFPQFAQLKQLKNKYALVSVYGLLLLASSFFVISVDVVIISGSAIFILACLFYLRSQWGKCSVIAAIFVVGLIVGVAADIAPSLSFAMTLNTSLFLSVSALIAWWPDYPNVEIF